MVNFNNDILIIKMVNNEWVTIVYHVNVSCITVQRSVGGGGGCVVESKKGNFAPPPSHPPFFNRAYAFSAMLYFVLSVHMYTYQQEFICHYSRLSSVLDMDSVICQQSLREVHTLTLSELSELMNLFNSCSAYAKRTHQKLFGGVELSQRPEFDVDIFFVKCDVLSCREPQYFCAKYP